MTSVRPVAAHRRGALPAVTHVDGSARVQTVDARDAPLFAAVLHALHEETGTPLVLNTSFNEREPIVCRPEEAIACFERTCLDALAIGPYLITRAASDRTSRLALPPPRSSQT
jgi:carbamoyltransferase